MDLSNSLFKPTKLVAIICLVASILYQAHHSHSLQEKKKTTLPLPCFIHSLVV